MKRINEIKHEILLEGVSFQEAREFIEKNFDEVYHVNPGYRIFGECYLVGVPPIAMGVQGFDLIFPIVKPRLGTSVIKARSEEDVRKLRDCKIQN